MRHILRLLLPALIALFAAPAAVSAASVNAADSAVGDGKIRVACIGNSVTYGMTIADREHDSYPAQLQALLGPGYSVGNFGRNSATLARQGYLPYMEQQEFRDAMAFSPEIAIIHLGLNDTDPRVWPEHRDEFEADYAALIDSLNAAAPGGRLRQLIVCRMTPIFTGHRRYESGTRDWHAEVQQAIERVARRQGIQTLDLYTPLHRRPDLFGDNLHPNAEGAGIIARTVYGAITGNRGGLQLPPIVGDGMVIQHDKPALSGTANVGHTVTVILKGCGTQQQRTATADINGRWSVELSPVPAGGPYTLRIDDRVFSDVLAGEVWLCSGQSNMSFTLAESTAASEYAALAERSDIRLCNMRERWPTYNVEWPMEVLDSINRLDYFAPVSWEHCTPESAARFSAVGYHFARVLADSLHMPVGVICNSIGGATTEAWVDRGTLERDFPAIFRDWRNNDFIQAWARGRAAKNVAARCEPLQRHPYLPAYLFETGIEPLGAYPIKGVVWFQGESNAHNKEAHDRLFTLLVDSWRENWNNYGLPIYYAQLSSLNRPSWTWFRDAQRIIQDEIRGTYMVVTSDVGDTLDVHFHNKAEVGERFALQALYNTYGHTALTPCGPTPYGAVFKPGSVSVLFNWGRGLHAAPDPYTAAGRADVDGGAEAYLNRPVGVALPTAAGEPSSDITTFELAGDDGVFRPARIESVRNGEIRLSADGVDEPVSVRYGWTPFTRANLVNDAGLPATTFRIDRK